MNILTEIEYSPKHIFTQSMEGAEQYAWYFSMHTIKKTTTVYNMHTHIKTYADLLIDYFIPRMIHTCRKLVILTGSGKEKGRSGVEGRGLRVVCLVFTV